MDVPQGLFEGLDTITHLTKLGMELLRICKNETKRAPPASRKGEGKNGTLEKYSPGTFPRYQDSCG